MAETRARLTDPELAARARVLRDARRLQETHRLQQRTACRRCGRLFAGLDLGQRTLHIAACEEAYG